MEKIWLKHYPAGVPADIDPNKYRSIRDLFEESVASFRDRPAYHCMGKELTFGDIDRMSKAFGYGSLIPDRRHHKPRRPNAPNNGVRVTFL